MSDKEMHPRNKYAEKPPDFNLLASLYPAFRDYVSYGSNQRARINWTDFNATRELTRSLLHHDYGISWWIPDGQLCPTITNRANYIHWIEDLLASSPAPWHISGCQQIAGIDIGTGANCIYPLLGTALRGWKFVGTDITSVALEWARWNVESNPHIAGLIEVRCALVGSDASAVDEDSSDVAFDSIRPDLPPLASRSIDSEEAKEEGTAIGESKGSPISPKESALDVINIGPQEPPHPLLSKAEGCSKSLNIDQVAPDLRVPTNGCSGGAQSEHPTCVENSCTVSSEENSPPVLVGVVREEERFDFCMCNPPFFASMEEAGLNPRTACGGTAAEMVCPGGEEAFVNLIIEDSVKLRHAIHWYTTMVGRKVTLKGLTAKLWALGAATVRTTEFVQGRTSRWGLAWSFTSPVKATKIKTSVTIKTNISFMLEGLGRGCSAVDVLKLMASQLQLFGASCSVSLPTFSLSGQLPDKLSDLEISDVTSRKRKRESTGDEYQVVSAASDAERNMKVPSYSASVFQQAPGSLLVKASLKKGGNQVNVITLSSGAIFADLFKEVERALKQHFASKLPK